MAALVRGVGVVTLNLGHLDLPDLGRCCLSQDSLKLGILTKRCN